MRPYSATGIWWLPETPDRQVAGTLNFDPESGIRLELVGTLEPSDDEQSYSFDPGNDVPVIHGVANAEHMNLMNCIGLGKQLAIPGILRESFAPRYLLRGTTFAEAEARFSAAYLRVEHLEEWSGLGRLHYRPQSRAAAGAPREIHVDYQPEIRVAELPNGYTVSLATDFPSSVGVRHFDLDAECQLEIRVPMALDFDQLGRLAVTRFSNLITFAVGIPCALKTLTVETEGGATFEVDTEWIFVRRGDTPRRHHAQMLLPLSETDFQTLIWRWFRLYEDCERALNTLFGLSYAPPEYTELQFVTAVTAAEALHSGLELAEATDREALSERKSQIVDAIASVLVEQDWKWVESLLVSAGGPTLKTRLRELWMYVQESAKLIVANRDHWVNAVAYERNNRSHPGKGRFEPIQLFLAKESVVRIVTLCVLQTISEDPAYAANRIRGLSEWQHLTDQIGEHIPEWTSSNTAK